MTKRADSAVAISDRAPPAVRRIGYGVGTLAVCGALYLIAVRGEAIIVDLSTLAQRFWCF